VALYVFIFKQKIKQMKNLKFSSSLFAIFLFINIQLTAQNVAINNDGSTANSTAILDIKSTAKGMLVPRMTSLQRTGIISPANGLLVFDTDSISFSYFDGSSWLFLKKGNNKSESWSLDGNNIASNNFIGTTNNFPLKFKSFNTIAGILDSTNQNTSLGFGTYNSTIGKRNTAFGFNTLSSINSNSGESNVAIGNAALTSNLNGARNTAIGDSAMAFNTSGNANVAIGAFAGKKTLGPANVIVGRSSMENNTTGQGNTTLGYYAMEKNIDGDNNIALGAYAKRNAKNGNLNIAIGYEANLNDTIGNRNIAIGTAALKFNATDNNMAVGDSALYNNTTGNSNVALGTKAGFRNITGHSNIAIGALALEKNIAERNVAIGTGALRNLSGNSLNTYGNTAIGDSAAVNLAIGNSNTIVGYVAFKNRTGGIFNTAIGTGAMFNAGIGGEYNTAIGGLSLPDGGGFYNIALGHSSGNRDTAGFDNTYLGHNTAALTGYLSNATAIGSNAQVSSSNSLVLGSINGINGALVDTKVGIGVTNPSEKLEIGKGRIRFRGNVTGGNAHGITWTNNAGTIDRAFIGMETDDYFGIFNFGLGWNVRTHNTSGEVGIFKQPGTNNSESRLQVKQSNGASAAQRGIGIETAVNTNRWDMWVDNNTAPDYNFNYNGALRGYIQNATGNYIVVSDKNLKKDIQPLNNTTKQLLSLQSYQYHYNQNKSNDPLSIGFMAQEVLKIFPDAVAKKQLENGKEQLGVNYQYFTVLSVKAIQEQQQQIDELKKENIELKNKLDEILLLLKK
jgi:trimeric autotransporter adhesin